MSVADYAPYGLRAEAFREIGGLDEGFAETGDCGIFSVRGRGPLRCAPAPRSRRPRARAAGGCAASL